MIEVLFGDSEAASRKAAKNTAKIHMTAIMRSFSKTG